MAENRTGKKPIKRVAILTGGGDAPGLNGVIRGAVKCGIKRYGLEFLGAIDGYAGLIKNDFIKLTDKKVSGILQEGGTILGTSNRDNPFHYPKIIRGKKVMSDVSSEVVKNLKKNKIDALIAIGGDGSLTIADMLYRKKGIPIIGVPKTIDNDLAATEITFGCDTALKTCMEALDKLHDTAESHHRVMVMECMGRYAGWITIRAGLAGGADIILIPEIPFTYEKIVEAVKKRVKAGKHFSIVAVAEGAKPKDGKMVVNHVIEDSPDPIRLGGIAKVVADEIQKRTGIETRSVILGHIQRGGSPTGFDRLLATRFGVHAVDVLMKRQFGKMVALKSSSIVTVSIASAVQKLKLVDPKGDWVATCRAVGTSFGDPEND